MKYTTILFDADGTLLDFDKCEKYALIEVLNSYNISATADMIRDYNIINESLWKKLERAEIDKESLKTKRFETFLHKFNIKLDPKDIADKYVEALANQTYYIDGAVQICEALSKKCKLYIITNGIKYVQDKRLKTSLIYPYLSDIFISEEVGYEKPNPKFFEAVNSKIPNFDKKSALVVGDSLTSDMAGGINYGIDVCWFNPKLGSNNTDLNINYTITKLDELLKIVF